MEPVSDFTTMPTDRLHIIEASTAEHFAAARLLIKEYTDFLYSLPNLNMLTDLQTPDAELAELETGKYMPPEGALLLAVIDDEITGIVCLRKLTPAICEMKRLYVRPGHRGASIGWHLGQGIIEKGKALGYEKMRLDTHPSMKKAHRLYYSLGFFDIARYNQNLVPGALFMEVELKKEVRGRK